MGIRAQVEGNLTKNPEGRTVVVQGEPRSIVELRVFSDVRRRVGDERARQLVRPCGSVGQAMPGAKAQRCQFRSARSATPGP